MIRSVLDTNVFVSAFLFSGRLNRLAIQIKDRRFLWLISDSIFEEYAAIARRPMFGLTMIDLERLLYQVKERAEWVHVQSQFSVIPEEPADEKFLGCAVDGRADWIVTGDQHLLRLKVFRGVRIGSPAEFLKVLRF